MVSAQELGQPLVLEQLEVLVQVVQTLVQLGALVQERDLAQGLISARVVMLLALAQVVSSMVEAVLEQEDQKQDLVVIIIIKQKKSRKRYTVLLQFNAKLNCNLTVTYKICNIYMHTQTFMFL